MNTKTLNPLADTTIVQRYNMNCLSKKVENKTALQSDLGWLKEPNKPIVCFPTEVQESDIDILKALMPGLLSLPVEFLVLGKGSKDVGSFFSELQKSESARTHIVEDKDADRHMMFAASDLAIFLADPTDSEALHDSLRFGVIPVSPSCDTLCDYDPIQETGTAFLYGKTTHWNVFAAVVRALETYRFPFDWKTIQKKAMGSVLKG